MPTNSAHPLHTHRLSIVAALAGCALFLVLILFLRQAPGPVTPDLTDVPEGDRWKFVASQRVEKLKELRAHDKGMAESYGWVDQTKGIVRLPIDEAIKLTLADVQKQR